MNPTIALPQHRRIEGEVAPLSFPPMYRRQRQGHVQAGTLHPAIAINLCHRRLVLCAGRARLGT
ncbi:MAG TPA: hypothetical protein IGR64_14930 [Leptolyngbyaceae cyanobacterium M65_K2018_010]|nr:hypothetical protein [Leptolyngbyaceae cyanobacterium M65_K2018_010]